MARLLLAFTNVSRLCQPVPSSADRKLGSAGTPARFPASTCEQLQGQASLADGFDQAVDLVAGGHAVAHALPAREHASHAAAEVRGRRKQRQTAKVVSPSPGGATLASTVASPSSRLLASSKTETSTWWLPLPNGSPPCIDAR